MWQAAKADEEGRPDKKSQTSDDRSENPKKTTQEWLAIRGANKEQSHPGEVERSTK